MIISYIGSFKRLHDEEYIALAFEKLGHTVHRIPQSLSWFEIQQELLVRRPDVLLFCKWECPKDLIATIENLQRSGMKTVCWLFDLYFGYTRENQVAIKWFFKADYVFTTDGGHQHRFDALKINHQLLRQGIRSEECYIQEGIPHGVVFVGTDSGVTPYRVDMIGSVNKYITDFRWWGRGNEQEIRGVALNELYGNTKIVLGDSFYSPNYWSNRVVETLGRGGFLIHPEVEGLKEEYPHLVTYKRGDWEHLKNLVIFYMNHEKERQDLIQLNYEWVKNNHTVEEKCAELIAKIT